MSALPHRMNATEWLMLAALSILWGGSFLFVGVAVKELPSFTIVATRVAVAALILLTVLRFTGEKLPRGRWGDFLVMAVLAHAAPFSLITWGQHHIPSGLAAILNATTPLFTMLVLWAAGTGERITPGKAAGLGFGFAGVCVLVGPKALGVADMGVLGSLAVLGATFSYGLSGWWVRRFSDLPPRVTATGTMAGAAMLMLPLAALIDRPWHYSPSPLAVGAVLALASVSTALAYLIFYPLLKRAGATNATLVTFLVPMNAILFGALLLHERLEWNAFAGMALIFTGLAAIDGRLWAWASTRLGRRRLKPV